MNSIESIECFRKAYEKAFDCKWKGGAISITRHLQRRKQRGHLSGNSTETDLIKIGVEILKTPSSIVYEYIPANDIYFVVYKNWALFFDENGVWDTVFPPDNPELYFDSSKGYKLIGTLGELIK